ncbi:MAG TPA: hypothetical protein VMS02_08855 [Solirubrobacteraceae bacterium]|nr:hypothetical protein [Solirubrobacteraceae bacterium]
MSAPTTGGRSRSWPVRHALSASLAALAVLLPAPAARAEFTHATLLSGTSEQQFEYAREPALSEDGRYAVFQGSLAGVPGIYRRDLQSGAIEPVAPNVPGTSAPSISANGQYVAFTTSNDLEPAGAPDGPGEPTADAGCPEVYVRDMEVPPAEPKIEAERKQHREPRAYTLASALNGSGEGILFDGCSSGNAGAQSAPGVAISADGRHVAFTVLGPSNLTAEAGAGCPAPSEPTPPSQVAVRDLQTRTTTLVSVTPAGCPTPGGGAYPSAASEVRRAAVRSTAAISADGSTVAWLGTDVGEQVPSAKLEIEAGYKGEGGLSGESGEVEPLWRRIADGRAASTRRLLGGAGLNLFFRNQLTDPAVFGGSFADYTGELPLTPNPIVLSADGRTVATLANAPTPAAEASALLQEYTPDTDAYVVQVPSESASPYVIGLTSTPDYIPARSPRTSEVSDVAISPDGTHVAFDTARTQFVLSALTDISPPSAFTEVPETYEADLTAGTLQRVTVTYDGTEPNGSASALALSTDGSRIAFASRATNLFYGDALRESEVYLAEESPTGAQAAAQEVGPQPTPAEPEPEWLLSARVDALPDGEALVRAQVPAAGTLAAVAAAQLPASTSATPTAKRHRVPRSRTAGPGRAVRGRGHAARRGGRHAGRAPDPALVTRTVAHAATACTASGEIELRVPLQAAYRKLAASADGLYAAVRVTFAAPDRRTLTEAIPVTFRRAVHASPRARSAQRKARARRLRAGTPPGPGAAG